MFLKASSPSQESEEQGTSYSGLWKATTIQFIFGLDDAALRSFSAKRVLTRSLYENYHH